MTADRMTDSPIAPAPLVIFGTGGSGTRVVAQIARHAGYWMGDHVNASEDALHIAEFLESAVDPYVHRTDWLNRILRSPDEPIDDATFDSALLQAVARHRASAPGQISRWGWKNPRCIFMLPLLHRMFPRMRAIHVIRDGRDMAYSNNQNQLDKHGRHLARLGIASDRPRHERSIMLWGWLNDAAATYGQHRLGDQYLLVRFEDLCESPQSETLRIYDFLGVGGSINAAIANIQRPESLGRWRRLESRDRAALTRAVIETLARFGYRSHADQE
jgi:hypothetical protein